MTDYDRPSAPGEHGESLIPDDFDAVQNFDVLAATCQDLTRRAFHHTEFDRDARLFQGAHLLVTGVLNEVAVYARKRGLAAHFYDEVVDRLLEAVLAVQKLIEEKTA